MKHYLITILAPPYGAHCYAYGTYCVPPITVFWLFGVISIGYSFMGGPLNQGGFSWYTFGLGLAMWSISAVWAILSIRGVEADKCRSRFGNKDQQVEAQLDEPDPLDQIRRT